MDVGRSTFALDSNQDEHRTSNIERPTSNEKIAVEEVTDDDDLPAPGKVWEGPRESLGAMMAKHVAGVKAEVSNIAPVRNADLPENLAEKWKEMISLLAQQGPAIPALLQQGQFVGIEDGRAVIRYAAQHESHVKLLERNGKKDLVRDALSKVMDQPVGIRFEIGQAITVPVPPSDVANVPVEPPRRAAPAPPPQPKAVDNPNLVRLTDDIRQNLYKSDPLIRAVVDQLGGSIIKLEE